MITKEQAQALEGHTPGPWAAHKMRSVFQIHQEGVTPGYAERIAEVIYWQDNHTGPRGNPLIDDARANARLIAAAPDLLATVIALHERVERLTEANGVLEDALSEAGDDYPGSSMQNWARQQIAQARSILKEITHD